MIGTQGTRRGRIARWTTAAAVVTCAGGIGACDSLLEVENPGAVEAADLENPALAQTIVNGALGQFECAYTSYVASTSLLADETINSSGWLNINGWGWRGLELETITGSCPTARNATGLGAYTPLQQAVYVTGEGRRLIESFPEAEVNGDKGEMLALLEIYGAFAHLLLGEGFCEMAIDQGPLLQPSDVVAMAEAKFSEGLSLADAAGASDLALLAQAGRARARLDLGDAAGAYADAAEIPEGFVWNAEYSTIDGVRENRVFNLNVPNRYVSANPDEYGTLLVEGQPDTRVVVENSGQAGHDGATVHWYQRKYTSAGSPIPMASWAEAKLVMAEARPSEAKMHIDELRGAQGLPALVLTGAETEADLLAIVLEERRRQLWLEGHRLNDMLRHGLAFPQGVNHKGQSYGPITCMPLPEQEKRANPNIPS
ncbi:MAG: RagB/SusD family nutrient uptake outer membrane protein [Gemmatimonadota bacterium]